MWIALVESTSLRLTTTGLKLTWEDALEKIFALMREAKERIEATTKPALQRAEVMPEDDERREHRARRKRERQRVFKA